MSARIRLNAAILSLSCAFSVACIGADTPAADEGAPVRIDGSNGVTPLVQALIDVYVGTEPSAVVTMGDGIGSRARLDSLRVGYMDIAMASHGLDTAALRAEGLVVHRIAETPVLLGVHASSVPVSAITSAQLCDVLAGRVTDWRTLGAPESLPIVVVVRPEAEVDMEVLREQVACAHDLTVLPSAMIVEETSDMEAALLATPGAIGVTTGTVAVQSNGAIRALALDGVTPDAAAVGSGQYTLVRSFFLITRGDPSAGVTRFLAFVTSPAGAMVIEANGSVGVR